MEHKPLPCHGVGIEINPHVVHPLSPLGEKEKIAREKAVHRRENPGLFSRGARQADAQVAVNIDHQTRTVEAPRATPAVAVGIAHEALGYLVEPSRVHLCRSRLEEKE
ncbi:MAG: hypothetical protein ABDH20_07950 [Thermus sp.]